MFRVRCASCRKTVAVAETEVALRNKVFCSEWCAHETPVTPNEERNDQWKALVAYGVSPVYIGKMYGSPHSQVYKSVAR